MSLWVLYTTLSQVGPLPEGTPWYIGLAIALVAAVITAFKTEIVMFGSTVNRVLAEKDKVIAEKDRAIAYRDERIASLRADNEAVWQRYFILEADFREVYQATRAVAKAVTSKQDRTR